MSNSPLTALTDATIFTGASFVEGSALLIQDGKVLEIVGPNEIPDGAQSLSYPGKVVAPAFIDCQINGGGNVLLNGAPDATAVLAIAGAHKKFGTACCLPTCTTTNLDTMRLSLQATRDARQKNPGILGIHFEGPHLDSGEKGGGCHGRESCRPLSDAEMELYRPIDGEVMLVTLCPEVVTPEQIKQLCARGVIVALGHSTAPAEQIAAAVDAGATGFTHLYNAMPHLAGREPGMAGYALADDRCWCSIITDGFHVSDIMIRVAYRSKPKGKLFLVSDAMPPAGSDNPQPFRLYGEDIHPVGGRCANKSGRLVGSSITLIDAVKYCITKIGVPATEALRMASAYPAAFLGLDRKLGYLLPGYEANAVILNQDYSLHRASISS